VGCGGRIQVTVATDEVSVPGETPASVTADDGGQGEDAKDVASQDPSESGPDEDGERDAGSADPSAETGGPGSQLSETISCDAGQPVQECVQYFALQAICTNDPGIALTGPCQAAALPQTPDGFARIQQLCLLNLQRLQGACR
jgi:hypothetical protein